MNKMLTAVAALQLVQAGTLRLDAPLGTYLPTTRTRRWRRC
jgi:CubicO group peptidase (beta-lactamase class C family)